MGMGMDPLGGMAAAEPVAKKRRMDF